MDVIGFADHRLAIDEIAGFNWTGLTADDLEAVALAYYFFSIQFRESLQTACSLYPDDAKLAQLRIEECGTDNLSPWPGVAEVGEKMDHDEFMRRTIALAPMAADEIARIEALGAIYLAETRSLSPKAKAFSIASYEDGGLETVFKAILRAPHWDGAVLGAFRHFLTEHIRFDSDPDGGHGSLSRHIEQDDRIVVAWRAFRDLLIEAVPNLAR